MLKRHLKIGLALALLLPLAQASAGKGDKSGGEKGIYKYKPAKPVDAVKEMGKAKRYTTPTPQFPYSAWGPPKEGPIAIYRVGSGKSPLRFFWFHGAGQGAENELVSRVANGAHAVGLNLEIISLPYEGKYRDLVPKLVAESEGKVLVGGHSMGGVPSEWLAYNMAGKVGGVVTMNAVTLAQNKGVPALHFLGENDFGRGALQPGFKWGDREVVVLPMERSGNEHQAAILKDADHSGRVRKSGDHDKGRAATSEATLKMDLAVANTLKDFLVAQKLIPAPAEPSKKK